MFLGRLIDGRHTPQVYALDPVDKHRPRLWRWGRRDAYFPGSGGWSCVGADEATVLAQLAAARMQGTP